MLISLKANMKNINLQNTYRKHLKLCDFLACFGERLKLLLHASNVFCLRD